MPEVGDIRILNLNKHIFATCGKCGNPRWTRVWSGNRIAPLCRSCQAVQNLVFANSRIKYSPEESREKRRERDRNYYDKGKLEVLEFYGGTPPRCAECGIDDKDVLCIDHINGGGRKHYLELYRMHTTIYKWLRKNDHPNGFQVLCANCNLKKEVKKRRNGVGQ